MRLSALTEEHRQLLYAHSARGFSASKCRAALYARFPSLKRYAVPTFRAFLSDPDVEIEVEKAREKIREEALRHSFAVQGSRVDVLNERVQSLRNQLWALENPDPVEVFDRELTAKEKVEVEMGGADPRTPVLRPGEAATVADVARLNNELRMTVEQIKREVDPLAGVEEISAPFQRFFAEMAVREMSTKEVRRAQEAETYSSDEEPN